MFYEYRSGPATLSTHTEKIKKSPHWTTNEIIFADPSAKQSRIDLESIYNIDTFSAINSVEDGIDLMRSHLEPWNDWEDGGKKKSYFYILDDYLDCKDEDLFGTHKEFGLYRYSKFQDGKVNKRQPIKMYDHGMDTARYVIASVRSVIEEIVIPSEEVIEQGGFWFRNKR